MAVNRKQPFGYAVSMGKIIIHTQEAELVREIYAAYATGSSYKEITDRMNAQPVPYHAEKAWNKNMVARILGNPVYTGDDRYPAILTPEEQRRSEIAKPVTGTPTKAGQQSKAIRQLARCADCGGRLTITPVRYSVKRWNCPTCDALTSEATSNHIQKRVAMILLSICADVGRIQTPAADCESDLVRKLENEFSQMLRTPDFDEKAAKSAVLALTAARFDALGSADYETLRIRRLVKNASSTDELDLELLRQITDTVLIHPDGSVSLKLKNNQIIKGV